MVAIVAGQGLGLLNTSLGLLGSGGQLGVAGQGRSGEGVYVNASTGNLVVQQQDEWLVGLGPDAGIVRTYNSLGSGTDDNGDNWRLGLSRQILVGSGGVNQAGSTIIRVGEDGAQVTYQWDASKSLYVSKSGGGSFDTLKWDGTEWAWQDGDTQVKEYYEGAAAGGKLKRVVDADGKTLTLTYTGGLLTRVATSNGDYIDIEYETGTAAGNGQSKSRNIKSLTTHYADVNNGNAAKSIKRVSYTYDDYNRLSQVTVDLTPANTADSATYWTKYTYVDNSGKLIKTLEQGDGSLLEFSYESGKVKTITDVRGSDRSRVTTFTYTPTNGTVAITDALGQTTTLTYEQTGGEIRQGQLLSIKSAPVGGKALEQSFTYDGNGNVSTITDGLGYTTVYEYDANGNRIYERDAQNNVVRRTYSSTNQLLTQTSYIDRDPDGSGSGAPTQALTTRYVYETAAGKTHQLRFVITPQGHVTQYVYNANGQRQKTVQYSADAYSVGGLAVDQVPALADMLSWASTKAATGLPTLYHYNALGQLDQVTTYASVQANGEGVADATQSITQYVYDQAGNLLKKIDGRQYVTEYHYDGLNRLTSVTDPASGLSTITSYVDGSRQTQVTALNGLVTVSTYDEAGRLLAVQHKDGEASLGTTTYTYDKLGQLTQVTQPTGEKTYYLYDAAGRKVGQIDGEGALTEYVYDAAGQVVRTLRYSTPVTSTMQLLLGMGLVGMPTNLLGTSGVSAWTYTPPGGNTTGLSNGTSIGTASEGTQGEQTRWIEQAAGSTAGDSSLSSTPIAVAPGQRYEFSVHASVSNATASMMVVYYGANNTLLGVSSVLDTAGGSQPGEKRLQGFVDIPTSPSGITQAKLVIFKSGSSNTAQSSKLQITHPLVSQASAAQTQVSLTDIRPPISGANDRSQWNIYDAAGRLVKTITSVYEYGFNTQYRGAVVEYRYDGAGRLSDTIAYATRLGATQMAAIMAQGAVLTAGNGTIGVSNASTGTVVTTAITLTQDAANDRRERVFYDADGRVSGQLDAENHYTENQYDQAGRLVRVKRYATPITGTVADDATSVQASQLQSVTGNGTLGGADQSTYYLYNARGQVKSVIDAELYATAYEYDAAGNKTKETRYASQTSTSAGTGKVLLGTLSTGSTRYVLADAGKDSVTTYEYDADNRLHRSVSQPSGLETVYDYDVQGNLLKTTAAVGQSEERISTRRYDKLGRLTAELSAQGGAALKSASTQAKIDEVWNQYGTSYLYDDTGHRIATITPDGTGTAGNKTAYYYDKAGRLTHSINALGEVQTYTYNVFGDVTEERRLRERLANPASYGGGLKTQALLDAVGAKASPTLDSIVSSTYDRAGLLLSRSDTLGAIASYHYNTFGQVESADTPNTVDLFGLQTSYTYDRRGLLKTTSHGNGYGGTYDTAATTYDAFGRLSTRTDERGHVTQYFHDKLGRQIYVYAPGSEERYSAWTYDAFGRVLTAQDPQGNTSTYSYDEADRSMTITLGGVSTTTRRDRLGQTVEVVDGQGNRTRYTYNADGQLTSTGQYSSAGTLVQGTETSTQYDMAGRVARTVNEQNSGTKVVYDADSRVISRIVDEGTDSSRLNLTSQVLYDGLGNAVWSRDAAGVWTQTTYDSRGRVTSVTIDPAKVPGTDSGVGTTGVVGPNLVDNASATPLNQRTEFTYNEDGTVLRVTRGAGSSRPEVTAYQYDSLGRRVMETRDPDGMSLWTAYAYDAGGNMIASMDKLGHITRYVYNADGQVTYVVDATGAVVKTDYDANGRVTRTLAYADRISAANLATLGLNATWQDVQSRLPSGAGTNASNQVTYKVYDARGQLTWSIDALGYATQREYDASGNVARVTRYADKPSAFNTAGTVVDGRVSFGAPTMPGTHAQADQVDQYVYDAANRQIWHIDAMGYATRTLRQVASVVKELRYANAVTYPANWPAGTLVSAISVRSAEPGPSETVTTPYIVADDAKDHQVMRGLDALGREYLVLDAEGYITKRSFDATGHLKTQTRYTREASEQDNDLDPGNAKTIYDYDAAGNLTKVTDPEGVATVNTYDQAGRLTDTTLAAGTSDEVTTHYVLDAAGRTTEEVRAYGKPEQASTRYVLDALGQRTGIIDPRGIELAEGTSTWAQNERQRLIGTPNKPAVGSDNYKTLLAQYTTTQTFDAAGRVTTSTDPLGGITRTEYDAFGNAVKVTAPNNSVGYFYFDNNNQATWHIDPEGYAVQTVYNGFGEVESITRFDAKYSGTLATGKAPLAVANAGEAGTAGATLYVIKNADKDATTRIEHDKLGRQTKITDAENNWESMAYDGLGNKFEYTNKLGGKYTYTFDKLGRVLTETAPEKAKELDTTGLLKLTNGQPTLLSVVTRFEYDARGNVTKKVEGDGLVGQQRTSTYTYDLLDRLKTTTGEAMDTYTVAAGTQSAQVPVETRWYDKRGNLVEIKAADGARTLTYWDALDRKVAEVGPTGVLKQWDYADDGKVVEQRVYDDLIVVGTDTRGGARPQPLAANVSNVRQILYTYDANHRLTKTVVPGVMIGEINPQTGNYEVRVQDLPSQLGYDANGNVVSETDARGNTVWHYYDKSGREVARVDAERYVTTWERDSAGNITTQVRYAKPLGGQIVVNAGTQPEQITAAMQTDDQDRVVVQINDRMGRIKQTSVMNVQAYALDGLGHANLTVANGKDTASTHYEYNGLGQLIEREEATGEVLNWDYDTQGRQVTAQGAEFKAAGWQSGQALTRQRTDSDYNALGQVIRQIERGTNDQSEQDDRITQLVYGKNGRLERRIDALGVVTTFKYDLSGRTTARWMVRYDADHLHPVTDITTYQYDAAGQQVATALYSLDGAGAFFTGGDVANHTALHREEVRYNAHGQIAAKSVNGGWQQSVTYDKAGHAIKSNADGGATKAYMFDANGNTTLTIESTGVDLQPLSLLQILQREDLFTTASVYSARNLLTDSYEVRDLEARDATGAVGWQSLALAASGSAGQLVAVDAASVAPPNAGDADLMSQGSFARGVGISVTPQIDDELAGLLQRTPYIPGSHLEARYEMSGSLLMEIPDTSATGAGAISAEFVPITDMLPVWSGDLPADLRSDPLYNEVISTSNPPVTFLGGKVAVELMVRVLPGRVIRSALHIYKMVNGVKVDISGPINLTVDATTGQNIPHVAFDSGGNGLPSLIFKDQPMGASRIVLSYRGKETDSPWKVMTIERGLADSATGMPMFALNTSQVPMPPNTYEMRYVAINDAGDILNSEEGTLAVTSTQITATQTPRHVGAGGQAFMDTDGNLNFTEQGGNSQTATLVITSTGGVSKAFNLAPTSINGKAIPGWFRITAAELATLTGGATNYTYVLTCLGANGTTVTSKIGGAFSTTAAGVNAATVTLQAIQISPVDLMSIGSFSGGSGVTLGSITYDPDSRREPSSSSHGYPIKAYDEIPEATVTLNLPDLSGLGSGEVFADITNPATLDPLWGKNASGQEPDNTVYGLFVRSYYVETFSATVATVGNTVKISVSGRTAVGETLQGSVRLYKLVNGVKVYISDAISITLDGTGGEPQLLIGNVTSPTLNFRNQPAGATRVVLSYRVANSGAAWKVVTLPQGAVDASTGLPIFGLSTADLGITPGTYEMRYVAINDAGDILNSEEGTLAVTSTQITATQTPRHVGGGGQAFTDTDGNLNFTEQGGNAASATLTVLSADGQTIYSAPVMADPAVLGGKAVPGWFQFDLGALNVGSYQYILESWGADGKSLVNLIKGVITKGTTTAVTVEPLAANQFIAFQNLPLTAISGRVFYRPRNSSLPMQQALLTLVSPGKLMWKVLGLQLNAVADYEIFYEAFDQNGLQLAGGASYATIGGSAASLQAAQSTLGEMQWAFYPKVAGAVSMVLHYGPFSSNGGYPFSVVIPIGGDGRFVFDTTALLATEAGNNPLYQYWYELKDQAGNVINVAGNQPLHVYGQAQLAKPLANLQQVLLGVTDISRSTHRSSVYNAFGEIVSQTDTLDHTTNFTYNTLGKLVSKEDPTTDVVDEHGLSVRKSPLTLYGYDLQGRLVRTQNANGAVTTQRWTAENVDGESMLAAQYNPDGGIKYLNYDRFGDQVESINENWDGLQASKLYYTSTYEYDKLHRLTQVMRPTRRQGYSVPGYDRYVYDEAGNRVRHYARVEAGTELPPETSYFDGLGRVVRNVSAADRNTTVVYEDSVLITGLNGQQTIGSRKTTTDANGRTLIDEADIYGRLTKHTDLGGRVYQYSYNGAGLLIGQTSSAGQDITYHYYRNGLTKQIADNIQATYTSYAYDSEGNKTYEAYAVKYDFNVYQRASISYDELNRIKSIVDPQYTLSYSYDAMGNRRRVTGTANGVTKQDYWYTYDSMNRFLVTMGQLTGAAGLSTTKITAGPTGSDGIEIAYDRLGQRIQANIARNGHSERYEYTEDGFLSTVKLSNTGTYVAATASSGSLLPTTADFYVASTRDNDLLGRVKTYTEYYAGSNIKLVQRDYTYDGDGKSLTEFSSEKNPYGQEAKSDSTTYFMHADGTLEHTELTSVITGTSPSIYKTYYEYEWWDSAQQSKITKEPYNKDAPNWKEGTSYITYDLNGHVRWAYDKRAERTLEYVSNAQGLTLFRTETAPNKADKKQTFFYVNGERMGEMGNDGSAVIDYAQAIAQTTKSANEATKNAKIKASRGLRSLAIAPASSSIDPTNQPVAAGAARITSANFDQNYQAINNSYPGFTSNGYTVRADETLESIARNIWGDSSLWYLLADANGIMSASTELKAGQPLVVPNKVTNIHNSSETTTVYDPAEALGNLDPTLPPPPPKPAKKRGGLLGGVFKFVMVAIAAVFTAVGAALGGPPGAAIGAALGSLVSQAIGVMVGVQEDISWSSVAMSALSAGVTYGLGDPSALGSIEGPMGAVVRGVAGNVITQGVGVATGLQQKFDWSGVAAAGMSSLASYGMSEMLNDKGISNARPAPAADRLINGALSGVAGGVASAVVRGQKVDWVNIAADSFGHSFGSALGDAVVGSIQRADAQKPTLSAEDEARQRYLEESVAGPGGGTGKIDDRMKRLQELTDRIGAAKDKLELQEGRAAARAAADDKYVSINIGDGEAPLTPDQKSALALGAGPRTAESASQVVRADEFGRLLEGAFGGGGTDSGISVGDLASRFGQGVLGAVKSVTVEPVLQVRDMGAALFSVTYNELLRGDGDAMWFPEMKSGMAQASANGASQGRLLLQSTPVLGFGVASYDLTTAVMNRDWGAAAESSGGLLGSFAIGAGVNKYGGYGIAFDAVSGPMQSQMGAINPRFVKPIKVDGMPDLATNPKHIPGGDGYNRNGGTQPADYVAAYEKAITANGGKSWFAASTDGTAIYRYADSGDGTVHWNGSTADASAPLTRAQVPPEVAKQLGFKTKGRKWK